MEDYYLVFKGTGIAFALLFLITACFAPVRDAAIVAIVGTVVLFIVLNMAYFVIDRFV